jgi:hypothetical protein
MDTFAAPASGQDPLLVELPKGVGRSFCAIQTNDERRDDAMNPEKALELVREMEELIELGGRTDPPTLQRIGEIASSLEGTGDTTGIIDEKLNQLRSWALILFSERQQKKWGRGPDDIKNILRVHCIDLREGIRSAIERTKGAPST